MTIALSSLWEIDIHRVLENNAYSKDGWMARSTQSSAEWNGVQLLEALGVWLTEHPKLYSDAVLRWYFVISSTCIVTLRLYFGRTHKRGAWVSQSLWGVRGTKKGKMGAARNLGHAQTNLFTSGESVFKKQVGYRKKSSTSYRMCRFLSRVKGGSLLDLYMGQAYTRVSAEWDGTINVWLKSGDESNWRK